MQPEHSLALINNFSFRGLFWIQITEDRITFESPFLPDKVHLTLAYNSSSEFVNFHLSKNVGDTDAKPRIEIFRINKTLLKQVAMEKLFTLIGNLVEPIGGEFLSTHKGNQAEYISLNDLGPEGEQLFLGAFEQSDYKIIPKDKKLRVTADLVDKLTGIAGGESFKKLWIKNVKPISESTVEMEAGVLNAGDKAIAITKLFGTWYKLKDEYTLCNVLQGIVSPATIQKIQKQFIDGLEVIKGAKSLMDTEAQNKKSVVLRCPAVRRLLGIIQALAGRSTDCKKDYNN